MKNDTSILRAGVIGWPISHSLSPKLHGYWLRYYGINGEYKAYPVSPEELEVTLKTLIDRGMRGCNITIPHKERALGFMDVVDETACSIGAINTVMAEDRKLIGSNTDAYGFMAHLTAGAASLAAWKKHAVVIGAGGAAKAIIYALHKEGVEKITVINRTPTKAGLFQQQYGSIIHASIWGDWSCLGSVGLLVNTTSLGMQGQPPLEINLEALPQDAVVMDIVYRPLETELLRAARARGLIAIDGLGMLLHQAVPGFEAWFGVRPEVTPELISYMRAQC